MFEHIEGVISVNGDLYVKTPEALKALMEELRKIGYAVKNLRQCEYRAKDKISVETMEKEGWSLWFASVDIERGKCPKCKKLMSTSGIALDNHVCEHCGAVGEKNSVLVWEGKEYSTLFSDIPIQQTMSIHEAWHWAPLPASPTIHRKILRAVGDDDDKGWHHQDGSPWFTRAKFAEMGKFIRHFTTLDADAWDTHSQLFRLDGPGGIDDVARFCHKSAVVQNKPNMFNALNVLGKIASGQKPLESEMAAAADALKDPEARGELKELLQRL